MDTFGELLSTRTDQIDEDLLEMVNSFTDFCTFKELMVECKKYYEGGDNLRQLAIKGTVIRDQPSPSNKNLWILIILVKNQASCTKIEFSIC